MKIIHRHVAVAMDDDPRVAVIELVRFGRSSLPLFTPPPAQTAAPVTP